MSLTVRLSAVAPPVARDLSAVAARLYVCLAVSCRNWTSRPIGYAFRVHRRHRGWLQHATGTSSCWNNTSGATCGWRMMPTLAGGQREFTRVHCGVIRSWTHMLDDPFSATRQWTKLGRRGTVGSASCQLCRLRAVMISYFDNGDM